MNSESILRPNPNHEEELENATYMDNDHLQRVLSYSNQKPKGNKVPKSCSCKSKRSTNGVAPLIQLSSGKKMPAFGLGTWLGRIQEITESHQTAVEEAVRWAIDAGYRHFDTAQIYNTEKQVGQAIRKKIEEGVVTREEVFVTTKLWKDNNARNAVSSALRESLDKLGLQYVDLYLIHSPTSDVDYVDTWRGMIEARDQGFARSIGVSNFNKHQLERLIALSTEKPAVLQNEINLTLQEPELREFCRHHNITIVAYTPFGSLFHRKAKPDAPPPRTDEPALLHIADMHKKTVSQIALRYLIELGVVPIPKSVTKHRIEQNIDVFDFQLSRTEHDILKRFDRGYHSV